MRSNTEVTVSKPPERTQLALCCRGYSASTEGVIAALATYLKTLWVMPPAASEALLIVITYRNLSHLRIFWPDLQVPAPGTNTGFIRNPEHPVFLQSRRLISSRISVSELLMDNVPSLLNRQLDKVFECILPTCLRAFNQNGGINMLMIYLILCCRCSLHIIFILHFFLLLQNKVFWI